MFTREFDRKIHIFLAVFSCSAIVGVTFGFYALWPANVERGYAPEQPIAFSHALHAGSSMIDGKRGLQIDCLYCHSRAEEGPHATVPTVSTCMNCHREVQTTVQLHEAGHEHEVGHEKKGIIQALAVEPGGSGQGDHGVGQERTESEEGIIKEVAEGYRLQEDIAKLLEHYTENKPIRWVKVHDLADFVYFDHSRHMQAGLSCQDCHGEVERMERMTRVHSLKMKWCLDCHQQPATETTSELYRKQMYQGREGLRGPIHCSACHR